MIQWLGLGTSTTQSVSWIPAQGTKLLRTVCHDQKKKKDTTNTKKRWGGFSIFLHFTHSEGFSIELVGGGGKKNRLCWGHGSFLTAVNGSSLFISGRPIYFCCYGDLQWVEEEHGPFLSPHNFNKNMYADLSLSYHTSLYQWRDLLR